MPKLKTLTENQAFLIRRAFDWAELRNFYKDAIEELKFSDNADDKMIVKYCEECLVDIDYILRQLEGD